MPAKKTALTEVSPKVKEYLTQEAIKKQLPDYYAKLKKDANVEILDEKLKPKENADDAFGGQPPVKADAKTNKK